MFALKRTVGSRSYKQRRETVRQQRVAVGEVKGKEVYSTYMDSSWKRGPKKTRGGEIDRDAPLGREAVRRYLVAVQRRYSDTGAWPTAFALIIESVEAIGYPVERTTLVRIINKCLKAADDEAEVRVVGKLCAVYGCTERTRKLTDTPYGSLWLCDECRKNVAV